LTNLELYAASRQGPFQPAANSFDMSGGQVPQTGSPPAGLIPMPTPSLSAIGSVATPGYNPPPSRLTPPSDMTIDRLDTQKNRYPAEGMENSPLNTKETGLEISMDAQGPGVEQAEEHRNSTPLSELGEFPGGLIRRSTDSGPDQEEVKPYGLNKRNSTSRMEPEMPMDVSNATLTCDTDT
jgi:hypothetical protein